MKPIVLTFLILKFEKKEVISVNLSVIFKISRKLLIGNLMKFFAKYFEHVKVKNIYFDFR